MHSVAAVVPLALSVQNGAALHWSLAVDDGIAAVIGFEQLFSHVCRPLLYEQYLSALQFVALVYLRLQRSEHVPAAHWHVGFASQTAWFW